MSAIVDHPNPISETVRVSMDPSWMKSENHHAIESRDKTLQLKLVLWFVE